MCFFLLVLFLERERSVISPQVNSKDGWRNAIYAPIFMPRSTQRKNVLGDDRQEVDGDG